MRFIGKCLHCQSEFTRCISKNQILPKFCSRRCKGDYQSVFFKGDNNPNFGKQWTEEMKVKQSSLVLSKIDDDYREKCGSANRGKKFTKERIDKMHGNRTSESYIRKHNEEVRKKIGKKSKEKFTIEFKEKLRKTNEETGIWIPLELKSDWEIYKKESNWINQMFDFIDDSNQLRLLSELKVFHYIHNKDGVVRDHLYSRHEGFKNKVFPEILRHPANCKIISHKENVKKGIKSALTLEELFCKIKEYKKLWNEQDLVLSKIEDYKNGKRWDRKEASE